MSALQFQAPARLHLSALCVAALLAACGGGSDGGAPAVAVVPATTPPTPAPGPTTLSGTVAVGAPITDGKLRVLDASGNVVVAGLSIGSDGKYASVVLTGTGPWRIEACGYAGPNYQCIYSVAQAAGTANVTPLTNALMLLAGGQQPEALMTGAAPTLTASSLNAAQNTLRLGLAPVLADAGVGSTLDLVSGTLDAGSRTGYDRVLDAVGVSTGVDGTAFVQIVPRLGSGNLYIEQGTAPIGSLATATAASALPLAGLETLFRNMTLAARTAATCSDTSSGMASVLSSNASMDFGDDGQSLVGPAQVAAGLCTFLAGGNGEPARLGARFMSPTLGRCSFGGSAPVCGISFALQDGEGNVEQVGQGMAVTFEAGAWKFKGKLHAISIEASARVQRDRRIDDGAVIDSYARALAFEIPALNGLACAKVSQHTEGGGLATLAYFKPYGADAGRKRLSAWRSADDGGSRSLNPASGLTRSSDDTWLELPQGEAGDTAVRNFLRGGRSVTVALYSDAGCTAAFNIGGQSSFEVDVDGVPPVWSALPGLPWPTLTTSAAGALRSLAVGASSIGDYSAAWGYTRGSLGVDGLTFCTDRALCGDSGSGRAAETRVRPGATSAVVHVRIGANPLGADAYKMLAISGRTGDGVGMQSNHMSCPAVPTGLNCEH